MRIEEIYEEGLNDGIEYMGQVPREDNWALSKSKKLTDRIQASLSLLGNPVPGMTVRLETGDVWTLTKPSLSFQWQRKGYPLLVSESWLTPLLRAAVSNGAVVSLPGVE